MLSPPCCGCAELICDLGESVEGETERLESEQRAEAAAAVAAAAARAEKEHRHKMAEAALEAAAAAAAAQEAAAAASEARQRQLAATLAPEPVDSAAAVAVLVRLPSAARLSRRFARSATLGDVHTWVEASLPAPLHAAVGGQFELVSTHPRLVVDRSDADASMQAVASATLADAGLEAQALLNFRERKTAAADDGGPGNGAQAMAIG